MQTVKGVCTVRQYDDFLVLTLFLRFKKFSSVLSTAYALSQPILQTLWTQAAVRSKAVVLLLLAYCFMYLP